MIIGFTRVSPQDQNPQQQRDALERAGCDQIFEERDTGPPRGRAALQACLATLREGDTLMVWTLDHLAKSLEDLVTRVDELNQRGVGFRSLTEAIDTTSASGETVVHLFNALAEFEHSLVSEPTLEELLAECDPDAAEMEELKLWQDAEPVGREVL